MDRRVLTHAEAADDLPAYLAGVLDAAGCAAMADHLAHCPACQAEQRRIEVALGALATLVPAVAPPAGLRERFLDRLDEPAEPPAPPAASSAPPADQPAGPSVRPLRRYAHLWSRVALASAAVLILGLAIWVGLLSRDLSQTRAQLTALQQEQTQVASILAGYSRAIALVPDNGRRAYGTLYVGANEEQALLVVRNLPPTQPGRVYQVWLVANGQRTSAGVFATDATGKATMLIGAPAPLGEYQSMGITDEPGPRGSPGPTGARVATCPLS